MSTYIVSPNDINIWFIEATYNFWLRIKRGTIQIFVLVVILPLVALLFTAFIIFYSLWFKLYGAHKFIKKLQAIDLTKHNDSEKQELSKIINILIFPPVQKFYKSILTKRQYKKFSFVVYDLNHQLKETINETQIFPSQYKPLFYDWDGPEDQIWETV